MYQFINLYQKREKKLKQISCLHFKIVQINNVTLISYGIFFFSLPLHNSNIKSTNLVFEINTRMI